MSSYSTYGNYSSKSVYKKSFNPTILLLLIVPLLVIYFLINSENSSYLLSSQEEMNAEQIRVIEVVSGHAWSNHGTEVNSAFNCLGKNGSTKSFKTFGFKNKDGSDVPTNLWLCFDGNDWYAIVTTVFQKVSGNKVARLVTSYKVSKDLFPEISDYITYVSSKWGAIEILYKINPSEIFLQPK